MKIILNRKLENESSSIRMFCMHAFNNNGRGGTLRMVRNGWAKSWHHSHIAALFPLLSRLLFKQGKCPPRFQWNRLWPHWAIYFVSSFLMLATIISQIISFHFSRSNFRFQQCCQHSKAFNYGALGLILPEFRRKSNTIAMLRGAAACRDLYIWMEFYLYVFAFISTFILFGFYLIPVLMLFQEGSSDTKNKYCVSNDHKNNDSD